MTTPQRITPQSQPQFPCWLWHRIAGSQGCWYLVREWQPLLSDDKPEDCNYAYWAPIRDDNEMPPQPEPHAATTPNEKAVAEAIKCAQLSARQIDADPRTKQLHEDRKVLAFEVIELRAQNAALKEERDLAIAHDRQPYPTADAYEAVCAALNTAKEKLKALTAERDELRRWKDEALAVEASWDCQAVGKLIGVPLGQNIRPCIEPAIRRYQQDIDTLMNNPLP